MIKIYTNERAENFDTVEAAQGWAGNNYIIKNIANGQVVTGFQDGQEYVAVVKAKAA
jgi:hypothetical protein